MDMYEIITKKKHGLELTDAEIRFFVDGYTKGEIPDYQASSLLMAICLCGMSDEETFTLTDAMASSGDELDLSEFGTLSADKHSTGGVGDKTTLVVAPIAASLGCKMAKMSGRGLGHTGGTVDKLESFSGYRTDLSSTEFFETVRRCGISVIGQSGDFAPADKKLYALRDVTATVDSIPLISSSIMSKKLAAGSHNIVLDVKFGSGGFMKNPIDAEMLAEKMVKIGTMKGRRVSALITNMDIPLGHAVGNILEVLEAIDTLKGNGPSDLTEVCLALASAIVSSALDISIERARKLSEESLKSGKAYSKFKEWIENQGGDVSYIDNPEKFKRAKYSLDILAESDAYIEKMDTELCGHTAVLLGAGRMMKDDVIDHAAGLIIHKKTGDKVNTGDVLATLYANDEKLFLTAKEAFSRVYTFTGEPVEKAALVYKTIRK
jgi:pyrimidine-nucleoside phosphorylase